MIFPRFNRPRLFKAVKPIKEYVKYVLFFTIILSLFNCKAQSPVVAIDDNMSDKPSGTYFKDLDNELDKFEGTWLFTNGNTSLKIILYKIEMNYDGSEFYFDDLRGEYQYIENSTEIINTIPNITNNPSNHDNRNILVQRITSSNERPVCNDCSENERRVSLGIIDPEREYLDFTITLRYMVGETGPEKITATIFSEGGGSILPYENAPTSLRVPRGEYLMEKQ